MVCERCRLQAACVVAQVEAPLGLVNVGESRFRIGMGLRSADDGQRFPRLMACSCVGPCYSHYVQGAGFAVHVEGHVITRSGAASRPCSGPTANGMIGPVTGGAS